MPRTIEGFRVTLMYDDDKAILPLLSDDGKIEWFQERMKMVYLRPIEEIFDQTSKVHKLLRRHAENDDVDFMIAAFSVLLSGIESLGMFLDTEQVDVRGRGEVRFKHIWCRYINSQAVEDDIKKLYGDFRSGIAHGFRIKSGSIDYEEGKRAGLTISPADAVEKTKAGIKRFFADIKSDKKTKELFLRRFQEAYPS